MQIRARANRGKRDRNSATGWLPSTGRGAGGRQASIAGEQDDFWGEHGQPARPVTGGECGEESPQHVLALEAAHGHLLAPRGHVSRARCALCRTAVGDLLPASPMPAHLSQPDSPHRDLVPAGAEARHCGAQHGAWVQGVVHNHCVAHGDELGDGSGLVRFGVFLRPDPRTCAAVTTITTQLRAQYGLVSAGRFPPHVTLAGSLALAGRSEEALGRVAVALDVALADAESFPMVNKGVVPLGDGLVYDVHHVDGRPNVPLVGLAEVIDAAVRPLLRPTPVEQLASDVYEPDLWRGHLSLASHELFGRADLREEVQEYVEGLAAPVPGSFDAEVVMLYRFVHPTWTGAWWTGFRWEHVRSWRLLG